MRFTLKIFITCIILYIAAQFYFLINIGYPIGFNFDEFHYVPAAKQFLALEGNRNWEHPPLAKLFMAAGIWMFGDNPLGWRFMSTVFGALTLVGMYLWGLAVFEAEATALLVTLLTLANQLLYVQARIGMLDTFMMAFLAWGFASFSASWNDRLPARQVFQFQAFSGIMFGFATACKWAAIVPWFFCLGLVVLVKLYQTFRALKSRKLKSPPESKATHLASDYRDWYTPRLFAGLKAWQIALAFGLLPLFCYYLAFFPYLLEHHEVWEILVKMQREMWDGQLRVVNSHPYMSQWTGWPFMLRPIWYAFDKEGTMGETVRGVLLLGNPVIMWTGLLAVLACGWAWIARRARDGFLIFGFYCALYFCWGVIPRKISFYYYYYPAGMTLSLAIAFVFHHWERGPLFKVQWARMLYLLLAFGMFLYFMPILGAHKIPGDAFRNYTWFSSWI